VQLSDGVKHNDKGIAVAMALLAESAMEEMINNGEVALNSLRTGLNWLDDESKALYFFLLKGMASQTS